MAHFGSYLGRARGEAIMMMEGVGMGTRGAGWRGSVRGVMSGAGRGGEACWLATQLSTLHTLSPLHMFSYTPSSLSPHLPTHTYVLSWTPHPQLLLLFMCTTSAA